MNNDDMLKHLNLLDKAKRDEKTTLRFAENFEVQSSAEGDYYKPNADHTDLVYDALKFKKLKFPNATATPEIGSTTTVAPPPSGTLDDGVSPIMSDITVYLEEGDTSYVKQLPCSTDFRFRDYIAPDSANGIIGDRWQIEDGGYIMGLTVYSYMVIINTSTRYGTPLDTTRTYAIKSTSHEGRVSNTVNIRFVQPTAV
jgi:hypothetical protein